jgi:hypothetical protein
MQEQEAAVEFGARRRSRRRREATVSPPWPPLRRRPRRGLERGKVPMVKIGYRRSGEADGRYVDHMMVLLHWTVIIGPLHFLRHLARGK